MMKPRKFSAEFWHGAVEQAKRSAASCAQVARKLGIRDNLLTRRKREAQSQGKATSGGTGTPRDEELFRLKRELARLKKGWFFFERSGVLCQGILPRYRMIERCHDVFPVRLMCRCLRVSARWLLRMEQALAQRPAARRRACRGRIHELHEDSRGALGAGRMREDLADEGETASLNRAARLISTDGLQGWPRPKRCRQRGQPALPAPGIRDQLKRDFTALEPETKWVTDITEIKTDKGKLYLCIMLDLHSHLMVGWSMHHRQGRQMVIRVVQMAVRQRRGTEPVILHSDRVVTTKR